MTWLWKESGHQQPVPRTSDFTTKKYNIYMYNKINIKYSWTSLYNIPPYQYVTMLYKTINRDY